ncbi:uncharacterized protein MONOS_17464 [Monocercomonoides exilis]|uniref:uncharacterized protein n=1 Tax=Monocercomonoides exilis TaxID=2049356 RepID=UPI00355AAD05|nr:hypothetical protein MONOS_17464 [Monocercomonoides exilis]
MIEEGVMKENGKNTLIDLFECYLLLRNVHISMLFPNFCVRILLREVLDNKESEEAKEKVEIALLALSKIEIMTKIEQERYVCEMKEIIRYHQEHHNLTHLAYQSAWQFLIYRLYKDESVEDVIVHELHFVKEATRELEELSERFDWKRKEKVSGEKDTKEADTLMRWPNILDVFFTKCNVWGEEYGMLIGSISKLFEATRRQKGRIGKQCLSFIVSITGRGTLELFETLKSNAVEIVLEEMRQSTMEDNLTNGCLRFLLKLKRIYNGNNKKECNKTEQIVKKRYEFERMEEEGYEDCITNYFINV